MRFTYVDVKYILHCLEETVTRSIHNSDVEM